MEEYDKRDERIIVINQKSGASRARNIGLKLAKGKYVTMLDSDDWIKENYLNKVYLIAEKNNFDLLLSSINIEKNIFFNENFYR